MREESVRRIEALDRVVRDLVAGRTTLPEAVARFRGIRQRVADLYGRPDPAADEEVARQVLSWCAAELAVADPGRSAEVMARLNAELRAMGGDRGSAPRVE